VAQAYQHFAQAAGVILVPVNAAKLAYRITSAQRGYRRVVQNPAMGRQRAVEVVAVLHAQCQQQLHVVVALAEFQVVAADSGTVRRDENLYYLAVYFVAEVVGLLLVESDDENTQ